MDTNGVDSFSVWPHTDLIHRKCFSTSILWKTAGLRERILSLNHSVTSPDFECAHSSWQLVIRKNLYKHQASYANHEFQLDVKKIRNSSESNVVAYCNFSVSSQEGKNVATFSSSVSVMRDKSEAECIPFTGLSGTTSQGVPPPIALSQPFGFGFQQQGSLSTSNQMLLSRSQNAFTRNQNVSTSNHNISTGNQNVITSYEIVKFSLNTFTIFFTIFVEEIPVPNSPLNKITAASVESVRDEEKNPQYSACSSNSSDKEENPQYFYSASNSSDEEENPLCSSCASHSLASDFEKLYNSTTYSDVTLKIGEDEFKAHKLVLSARSKVFAEMFGYDLWENRHSTVELVQMESGMVQDMLLYIYSGKVREFTLEEAINLYDAAERYDLQELKAICREVVSSGVSTSNVCDIAMIADLHRDESLMNALKPFISGNGKEIVKSEKWKEILTKEPVLCGRMIEWFFST